MYVFLGIFYCVFFIHRPFGAGVPALRAGVMDESMDWIG